MKTKVLMKRESFNGRFWTSTIILMMLMGAFMAFGGTVRAAQTTLYIDKGPITIGENSVSGYDASGKKITTSNSDGYIITQTDSTTANTVTVTGGTQAITLNGVNILSPADNNDDNIINAFKLEGTAQVTLTLAEGSTNRLQAADFQAAALRVPSGAQLTVQCEKHADGKGCGADAGCGSLSVYGAVCGSGIGSNNGENAGTITIAGGAINASHDHGYIGLDIGSYNGGTVNITGGYITGETSFGSNGIITVSGGTVKNFLSVGDNGKITVSGGTIDMQDDFWSGIRGGNNSTITITGGTITACGWGNAGIITGTGGNISISGGTLKVQQIKGGTFSTGTDGGAWITSKWAITSTTDNSTWSGVFFESTDTTAGKVYGTSVTLKQDATLPSGSTLTIDAGQTLTVPAGKTLTNNGTITNNGTLTVDGTLNNYGTIKPKAPTGSGTIKTPSSAAVTFAVKSGSSYGSDTTSAAYGDTVQLKATLSPAKTGGTVSFYRGDAETGTLLGTASNVTDGVATTDVTLNNTGWTPGSHTITAVFSGSNTLFGCSGTGGLTVNKAALSPSVSITGWTYGSYNPMINIPSVTGNNGNGNVTWYYKLNSAGDNTYTTTVPTDAGDYTVKADIPDTDFYLGSTSATADFTIAPKTIGIDWNNLSLTYNGQDQLPAAAATGLESSDQCSINLTGAGKAVGTYAAKASSLSNANYTLPTDKQKSFSINPAQVTITGAAATDRAYDGTKNVAVSGGSLVGVINGDTVTLGGTPQGTIESADVGTNKAVTVTGYTLNGTDTGNYTLTQPTGLTVNITQAALTPSVSITGWTYGSYNQTANSPSVTGNTGNGTVTWYYKLKSANDSTYTTTVPTDAGAYTVKADIAETPHYQSASATTDFTIAPKTIGIDWNNLSLTYNGQDQLPAAAATGLESSDQCSINLTGAGKAVGTYAAKASSLSNANYTLPTDKQKSFSINPAQVTITGAAATDRAYDSTKNVAVSGGSLVGVINGDTVTLGGTPQGTIESADVGTNKAVTVTGYTLNGTDTGNYTLTQPTGLTVNITQAALTPSVSITGWTYGSYNQTANSPSVTGNTGNGTVTWYYKLKSASDGDYKTDMPTNVGDYTVKADIAATTLYQSASATTDFTIAPKTIGINWSNLSLTYNGHDQLPTATATGLAGSDTCPITLNGAEKNAGSHTATATGVENPNYTLSGETKKAFIITPAEVTVSGITASDKIYDGTNSAITNTSAATLKGVLPDDTLEIGAISSFANKDVETDKTVNLTSLELKGTSAENYILASTGQQATTTASITARTLTVMPDGNQSKIIGRADPALTYGYGGNVSGETPGFTGTLSRAAGESVGRYDITQSTLDLADSDTFKASNYHLQFTSGVPFTITDKKELTIGELSITLKKEYDGTTAAAVTPGTLNGFDAGDDVHVSATAHYADKNAGTNKTITVTYTLSGNDADKYMTLPDTSAATGEITVKALTITGGQALDRAYDGSKYVSVSDGTLSGILDGDTVTLGGTPEGVMEDAETGTDKPVTVTGYTLNGTDAGNYTLSQPTGLTVNISKADQAAPAAPSLAAKTYSSITVNVIDGQKYLCQPATDAAPSADAKGWQDSGSFANLSSATAYRIYTFTPGTDNLNASPVSTPLDVTTDAEPVKTYSITAGNADDTLGTVSPSTQTVADGKDAAAITATPKDGCGFDYWSINGTRIGDNQNPLTLKAIHSDQTVTAHFMKVAVAVTPHISYAVNGQDYGWSQGAQTDGEIAGTTGKVLKLEAFKAEIKDAQGNAIDGLGISYTAHMQDAGWSSAKADGESAGIAGGSKRVEAITMVLTGDRAADYDIYYRVHVENVGWMAWAKNGGIAGTTGFGLQAEALQSILVKKGEAPPTASPDNDTTDSAKIAENIYTEIHGQNYGWGQGYQQSNQITTGTAGLAGNGLRLEALRMKSEDNDLKLTYQVHVQNKGWMDVTSEGMTAGTTGEALRMEAIRIWASGTSAAKHAVIYRVYVENMGWTDWSWDGATAGTTGMSRPIEAIQVRVLDK